LTGAGFCLDIGFLAGIQQKPPEAVRLRAVGVRFALSSFGIPQSAIPLEFLVSRKSHVVATVNGQEVEFLCEPRQSLLEALRDILRLTGAKEGCNNGNCGACTVMMNGVPVNSCIVLAVEADGAQIETVEAIAEQGQLHPLQQCFLEGAALQCGVCTPGFLVAAKALLEKNPNPSEHEIRFNLAGNLCRCTGYDKIVRAVQESAKLMRETAAATK
jgi:carbon-monoxide dehydrogenase small subunit